MVLSMPPYGSTNTFSSVFLFFPESSSGFSSAFRRARLSSVVGFVGLLVRTSSVSSFVMMRSLVGLMVPPPPSFFSQAQLLRVCSLRLQEHVSLKVKKRSLMVMPPVHSPASSPLSRRPQECRSRRMAGLATCLPSTSSEFNLCTTTRLQIVVHPVQ